MKNGRIKSKRASKRAKRNNQLKKSWVDIYDRINLAQ